MRTDHRARGFQISEIDRVCGLFAAYDEFAAYDLEGAGDGVAAQIYAHVHIFTNDIYSCIYTYLYTHIYVYIYTYIYAHVCIHVCIIYTYICTRTNTHMYV